MAPAAAPPLLPLLLLPLLHVSCKMVVQGAESTSAATVDFSLTDARGRTVVRPRASTDFLAEGPRRLEAAEYAMHLEQPLRLRFSSHGRDFEYDLYRNPSPIVPGAIIKRGTENGTVITLAQESFIFSSPQRDAVLGIVGDGVHGAVQHSGSYFDVSTDGDGKVLQVDESLPAPEPDKVTGKQRNSSAARRKLGVDMWKGCFEGNDRPHALSMGVAVGYRVTKRLADLRISRMTVEDFIALVLAKANLLFQRQMNLVMEVKQLIIAETSNAYPEWNNRVKMDFGSGGGGGNTCAWKLEPQLFKFSYSEQGKPIYYNRGLTWLPGKPFHPSRAWTTFAHEVGHSLNANHSFEDGVGKTGGIMDFGDGTLHGYYQFNSKYRREEICWWMKILSDQCKHLRELDTTCGNSIQEAGEACECAGGAQQCAFCCECKLLKGKQCTPNATSGSMCCTEDGMFKAVGERCEDDFGLIGYCFEGACRVEEECAWANQNLLYNETNPRNECEYLCKDIYGDPPYGRSPEKLYGYVNGILKIYTVFPEDTPCGPNSVGRCKDNGAGSRECMVNGQFLVSVAPPVGPTVAPKPALPDTANHSVAGCVGFGQQAFIGIPDIQLEPAPRYSFDECRRACAAAPTCESFIHSEARGVCELWTPMMQQEDLVHFPTHDTYICKGKAAEAYIPDCEQFQGDRVKLSLGETPDLGCPSCESNGAQCGSSSGCGGFTLTQCNQACLDDHRCHIFVHGNLSSGVSGYCELWSAAAAIEKKGTVMARRRLTALDESASYTFSCPCRGEGKVCPCRKSAVSPVRVACSCDTSTDLNECAAGMFCLPEGTCTATSSLAPKRRLVGCSKDTDTDTTYIGEGGSSSTAITFKLDASTAFRAARDLLVFLIAGAVATWSM